MRLGPSQTQQTNFQRQNSINRFPESVGTYLFRHIINAEVEGCDCDGGDGGVGGEVLSFEASGAGDMLGAIGDSAVSPASGVLFFFFAIATNDSVIHRAELREKPVLLVSSDLGLKYFCFLTTSRGGGNL